MENVIVMRRRTGGTKGREERQTGDGRDPQTERETEEANKSYLTC